MDSNEVISDTEAQAIREEGSNRDAHAASAGEVRDLHADHWERILPDRLPALESITERLVTLLKTSMHRMFRRPVDVTAGDPRSMRWDHYVRQLAEQSSLNVIEISNSQTRALVRVPGDFVFAFVDLLFGGNGAGERDPSQPDFTPMETRLVRKLVSQIANDIAEAWRPFDAHEFRLANTETNPVFAAIASSADKICVLRVGLGIGDHSGEVEIVIPESLIEPLRYVNAASGDHGRAEHSLAWRAQLKSDLHETRVRLRAVLLETTLSLGDLTRARPGDVIEVGVPDRVTLVAGRQALLSGSFGVSGGKKAVRILKTVGESKTVKGDRNG